MFRDEYSAQQNLLEGQNRKVGRTVVREFFVCFYSQQFKITLESSSRRIKVWHKQTNTPDFKIDEKITTF